jgi:hypothetical protein
VYQDEENKQAYLEQGSSFVLNMESKARTSAMEARAAEQRVRDALNPNQGSNSISRTLSMGHNLRDSRQSLSLEESKSAIIGDIHARRASSEPTKKLLPPVHKRAPFRHERLLHPWQRDYERMRKTAQNEKSPQTIAMPTHGVNIAEKTPPIHRQCASLVQQTPDEMKHRFGLETTQAEASDLVASKGLSQHVDRDTKAIVALQYTQLSSTPPSSTSKLCTSAIIDDDEGDDDDDDDDEGLWIVRLSAVACSKI